MTAPAGADSEPATATGSLRAVRLGDSLRFWLVFSACFGLLLFRGWDRIVHADLFAEGIRFVGLALNDGWETLLVRYDLFFHTAPKLLALLAVNLVPTAKIPLFTNVACVAMTAAAMATISRPAYRWLIPSDAARIVLALLMVLAPGLIEVYGNLAGLHWSLLLFLALLSLKDPADPFTVWELVLAVVVVLTSGGAVVFLAVALFRLVFAWRRSAVATGHPPRRSPLARELAFFSILFLVAAYLALQFLGEYGEIGGDESELDIVVAARGLDELLPHLGALFTTFYFLHPFLGTNNTSIFLVSVPFYPLVTVAATIVVLFLWRRLRNLDYRFWLIPAWLGAMLAFAVMLSIVRYWSFYGIFSFPYEDWWFRYNFIFACTGLVFWFALIRPTDLGDWKRWPTGLVLILTVSYFFQAQSVTTRASPPHDTDSFAIERYAEKNWFAETADDLASSLASGCPAKVKVAGPPGGKWKFVYRSPRAPGDCPDD